MRFAAGQAEEAARSRGGERHDLLAVGFRGREHGILPVAAVGERGGGWQNKGQEPFSPVIGT